MTLQPSTTNFSLINYSQEKDLNNLVAARKHQKNPEKCSCIANEPFFQTFSQHPVTNDLKVNKRRKLRGKNESILHNVCIIIF